MSKSKKETDKSHDPSEVSRTMETAITYIDEQGLEMCPVPIWGEEIDQGSTEDKRIRDFMSRVKLLDKFSFTLGVLTIVFSEWCLLRNPHQFPAFYATLMVFLMMWRYVDYKAKKCQFFMLDLCYFVNLSVITQYFFFTNNRVWFDVNYIMCSGPVCMAVVVWQNSLVFHSIDKVTSYFLHVLPVLMVHGVRWNKIPSPLINLDESSLPLSTWFYYLMAYVAWQVLYIILTQVVFAKSLRQDPDLMTSVRYFTRDNRNWAAKLIKGIMVKSGIINEGPNGLPDVDLDSMIAQVIFVVTQWIYTASMSLHPWFLFSHYWLSSAYFVFIFGIGVWNGASYYIEVFSKQYQLQFSDKQTEFAGKDSERSRENEKTLQD